MSRLFPTDSRDVYLTLNGFPLYGVDDFGVEWHTTFRNITGVFDGVGSTLETSDKAFTDGWFGNQPTRQGRTITIEGELLNACPEDLIRSWDSLKRVLLLGDQLLEITMGDLKRQIMVRQSSAAPLLKWSGLNVLKFSLSLTALSSYLQSTSITSANTGLPYTAGGMTFPYRFDSGLLRFDSFQTIPSDYTNMVIENSVPSPGYNDFEWNNTPHAKINGGTVTSDGPAISIGANKNIHVHMLILTNSNNRPNKLWFTSDYLVVTDIGTYVGDSPNTTFQQVVVDEHVQVPDNSTHIRIHIQQTGTNRYMGLWVGYDTPSEWVFGETTMSGSVHLSNNGTGNSPITMRIDGPVTNPTVTHVQSGRVMKANITLGTGHYLTYDGTTHQVLLDGTDPQQGIMIRREWSQALLGDNDWQFSADEYANGAKLTVSFREQYI